MSIGITIALLSLIVSIIAVVVSLIVEKRQKNQRMKDLKENKLIQEVSSLNEQLGNYYLPQQSLLEDLESEIRKLPLIVNDTLYNATVKIGDWSYENRIYPILKDLDLSHRQNNSRYSVSAYSNEFEQFLSLLYDSIGNFFQIRETYSNLPSSASQNFSGLMSYSIFSTTIHKSGNAHGRAKYDVDINQEIQNFESYIKHLIDMNYEKINEIENQINSKKKELGLNLQSN